MRLDSKIEYNQKIGSHWPKLNLIKIHGHIDKKDLIEQQKYRNRIEICNRIDKHQNHNLIGQNIKSKYAPRQYNQAKENCHIKKNLKNRVDKPNLIET